MATSMTLRAPCSSTATTRSRGGERAPEDATVFLLGEVTGSLSVDAGNKNADGPLGAIFTKDPVLRGRDGDFLTFGAGTPIDGRAFLPAGTTPTGPFWLLGSDDGKGARRRMVRFDAQGKFLGCYRPPSLMARRTAWMMTIL
jgi:hypothetical protein